MQVRWFIAFIACSFGFAVPASSAGVEGRFYQYDYATETTKRLPGRYRLDVVLDGQRVHAVSAADGTYRFHVGARGKGTVTVDYHGAKLSTDFESRYYDVHYDLYIAHQGERMQLFLRSKRVVPPRQHDPEN